MLEEVLTGNWNRITMSMFEGRTHAPPVTMDTKVKRACQLVDDGEIGRGYNSIISKLNPLLITPPVLESLKVLNGDRLFPEAPAYVDNVTPEMRDYIAPVVFTPKLL
jgi:hypothetical protein